MAILQYCTIGFSSTGSICNTFLTSFPLYAVDIMVNDSLLYLSNWLTFFTIYAVCYITVLYATYN